MKLLETYKRRLEKTLIMLQDFKKENPSLELTIRTLETRETDYRTIISELEQESKKEKVCEHPYAFVTGEEELEYCSKCKKYFHFSDEHELNNKITCP